MEDTDRFQRIPDFTAAIDYQSLYSADDTKLEDCCTIN
jgi:hypothetical protein